MGETKIEPKIEEKHVPSKTLKEDTEYVSKTNVETIVKPDVKAPDTLDIKEDDKIIKSSISYSSSNWRIQGSNDKMGNNSNTKLFWFNPSSKESATRSRIN